MAKKLILTFIEIPQYYLSYGWAYNWVHLNTFASTAQKAL